MTDQKKSPPSDNTLAFLDQITFELLRATGRRQLMQAVWVYDHPVDLAALQRFHENLGYGFFARQIQQSPLPFGRPRWVRRVGPPAGIDMWHEPWPRADYLAWADEHAAMPIDPEFGPSWRLGVVPLSDGSTAVSMVISHCVADGGGGILAVVEAATGTRRDLGLPNPPDTRLETLKRDIVQSLKDAPTAARIFRSAIVERIKSRSAAGDPTSMPDVDGSESRCVAIPCVVLFIETQQWDACAERLGGNSYSLLAGFVAKLSQGLGRSRASDGAVTLVIAFNDRKSLDDSRAIAMSFANAALDPAVVAKDLTPAREVIRHARQAASGPNRALDMAPLIPWLPRNAVKGIVNSLFAYSEDVPVSCSNMGELPPAAGQIDGTDAEYLLMRGADQNVTEREMQRSNGQLVIVSGRLNGKISISVEAYQPGAENSKQRLREIAEQTLTEFGLTGEIV
ncbi:WS/DGAT/MGAT family O-acyltransferase [Mycolicibacterium vinylchloridicum]|uniref:hypothetical protein n=1 Tax=Mycolicibacterium vinylchloridicum TaxID=2736928 RepID=UPI0015C71ECB|nr:hypothetical protein [Mycolicibacterium vinylchloridicum]